MEGDERLGRTKWYSDLLKFTEKTKLASIQNGRISFDASAYKYLYVYSGAGSALIPINVLKLLDGIPISAVRYVKSDWYIYIYAVVSVYSIDVYNNVANGFEISNVDVYGIR